MRPINSDVLGDKGEQRFAELCSDAGLICNRVGRDRRGWDYIVEFPFPILADWQPLDSRPHPLECTIQIKTVWEGRKYIKLRLSSAEFIAKKLQPTCIFVMVVRNNLEFSAIYGIHIVGDVLSRILKQIRICQASGSKQLNRHFISIDYVRYGAKLLVSGNSIKNFLDTVSGSDRDAYIRSKADQLANIGVIGPRYSMEFSLLAGDQRDLADVLLGLKKAKITDLSTTETRWGIDLPALPRGAGEILIKPKPHNASIIFCDKITGRTIKLSVGVTMAPAHQDSKSDFSKLRIFNEFLEIVIERSQGEYTVKAASPTSGPLLLNQRLVLNQVMNILTSKSGVMDLRHEGKRIWSIDLPGDNSETVKDGLARERDVLSKIEGIVAVAGGGDLSLSVDHINTQLETIEFLYNLAANPLKSQTEKFRIGPFFQLPFDQIFQEILVIGRLIFESSAIAFSLRGRCVITDDGAQKNLDIDLLRPLRLEIIGLEPTSYEHFDSEVCGETNIGLIVRL